MSENGQLIAALQTFVFNSLKAKLEKNELKNYLKIVEELSASKDGEALTRWYTALTRSVSLISMRGDMKSLVNCIFSFSFANSLPAIQAYSAFLMHLVSANVDFLLPTMKSLTQNLLYHSELHDNLEPIYNCINESMFNILRTVPSASTILYQCLLTCFPHKSHSVMSHKVYLKNLLRISEYAPELRDRILEMIVNRMIQIDVEIKSVPDEKNDDLSRESKEAVGLGVDSVTVPVLPLDVNRDMLLKLDAMLQLVLDYLNIVRNGSDRLCDEVFDSLMRAFERSIITTHKSKYTQFLLFYCCSFKHAYTEAFVKRLMERAVDSANNHVNRQCCAQYMASFLVHAAYLRMATRLMFFEVMVGWLLAYVESVEDEIRSGALLELDLDAHAAFYSICQAVLCVVCFRPDTFADHSEAALEPFQLDRIVNCALNPLLFCGAAVVERFAAVAYALHWVDCRERVAQNKRMILPDSPTFTQLISYFPFDSFSLPLSSPYLAEIYFVQTTEVHVTTSSSTNTNVASIESVKRSTGHNRFDEANESSPNLGKTRLPALSTAVSQRVDLSPNIPSLPASYSGHNPALASVINQSAASSALTPQFGSNFDSSASPALDALALGPAFVSAFSLNRGTDNTDTRQTSSIVVSKRPTAMTANGRNARQNQHSDFSYRERQRSTPAEEELQLVSSMGSMSLNDKPLRAAHATTIQATSSHARGEKSAKSSSKNGKLKSGSSKSSSSKRRQELRQEDDMFILSMSPP